jgi:hypothetical protein
LFDILLKGDTDRLCSGYFFRAQSSGNHFPLYPKGVPMSFKDFSASQAGTSNVESDDKTKAMPPDDKTAVPGKSEPVKKP